MNAEEYEDEYVEIYEPEIEERVYAIRPNKTQIKKEIALIAALAEEIAQLPASQLASLELPDNIYQAARQIADMPPREARKRQLKYVTGELRKIDLEPVQEKLARLKNKSTHAIREHHQAEHWRDKLIADQGHDILTQLLAEYPDADSQQIRQLQRNAKKELAAEKPPKSARLLYKYLKTLFEQAEQPTDYQEGGLLE